MKADADGIVIGSANGTWIDGLERAGVNRRVGDGRYESMQYWLPEMFAAGSFIAPGRPMRQGV